MSSLFRRKISCFFCNHQLSPQTLRGIEQYPSGRIRRFTCPECCADNHLDENGEIIDYVPDDTTQPAPAFARRRQSPRALHALTKQTTLTPTARSNDPPPSPTFCRTCLHNQQMVKDAIAAYDLPPEDHPDYDEHVNYHFPKLRAEWESMWPAVCVQCAPKVNDRIRTSNYQVKVASLGQMLARSSGYEAAAVGRLKDGGAGKKRFEAVVWWVRGVVWCWAHFVMLAWHGSAMVQRGMEVGEASSWVRCIVNSGLAKEVDRQCYGVAAEQARWLPWSLLGFFWIYKERALQQNPDKKLVGAKEYLKLECFVYAFRVLNWYFVAPGGIFSVPETQETFTRLHLGLFFLSLMTTLISITSLKLEDPPSFSLREPEPLPSTPSPPSSPPRQQPRPRHPMSPITPLRHANTNPPPSTGGSTFYSPVKFRARDISPSPAPRRTPVSPEDAMDWNFTAVSETTYRPPPPPQPSFLSQQRSTNYSPFSGTLPPAPRAPNQRLIGSLLQQPPPPMPPVRENFFAHRSSTPQGETFNKLASAGYRLSSAQYPPMAPQRFFVDDGATGLETLMGGGLRLDDEPVISARVAEEEWWSVAARAGMVTLALAGVAVWRGVWAVGAAMVVAGVVAGWREARVGLRTSTGVEIAVYVAFAAGSVYLPQEERGKVALALIAGCAGREVWAVLMRLQRGRARAFYAAEKRRVLEEEKEGRRRERDASVGSDRGSRGGSVGLERGRVVKPKAANVGSAKRGGLSFGALSL